MTVHHLLQSVDFKPYVGKDLVIRFSDAEKTCATVIEVIDLPVHPNLQRKPFSILFQTEQKVHYYPQAIYAVEHPALGALNIFLVPMGFKAGGMQYEAVFS